MTGECVRYTDLEKELFAENTMLRQNVADLWEVLQSAQVTMKALVKEDCDFSVYDYAESVLGFIREAKRKCSFRKTMFHRRYPYA